jgi:hypothetical protein
MKLYLITHTGKMQWYKLQAWADIQELGENAVVIKSVKAFVRKKYAKEWIKENNCEHLEIRSVEIK